MSIVLVKVMVIMTVILLILLLMVLAIILMVEVMVNVVIKEKDECSDDVEMYGEEVCSCSIQCHPMFIAVPQAIIETPSQH